MKKDGFFRLFPPPRFLRTPSIGIDLSDESVHILELEFTPEGHTIKQQDTRLIPPGLVKSGRIVDMAKMQKIFIQMRKDYGLRFVNVALTEQHGYVFIMRVPKMKLSDIYDYLELHFEERVPLSAKNAVIVHDIIRGGDPEENLAFIELSVSVYPKNILDEYIELFLGAGIIPFRFEIEAHAIARAVVPKGDKGTFMLLDFGRTKTGLSVVSQGVVRFTSTISVGGNIITRALAREFSISFKEAEKLKKEKGFLIEGKDQKILRALVPTISALKSEVVKHYQYWNTHNDFFGAKRPPIDDIILCGGLSNLLGFLDYLAIDLHPNIRLANVFENMNSFEKYIPDISFENSLQYATAVGLTLSRNIS